MQAALGLAQLQKLDGFIKKKRQISAWYSTGLKGLEQRGLVKLHPEMPWARCVYWMYSVLIARTFGTSRAEFIRKFAERGIETRPLFYPLHVMPPYRSDERFPVAEELSGTGISLPSAVSLTREAIRSIVSIANEVAKCKVS